MFGLSPETVQKIRRFSLPSGYTRTAPVLRLVLGGLLPVIDVILGADQRAPTGQRHMAKRIFERLLDEYGFAGGYIVVIRLRARGRFVNLVDGATCSPAAAGTIRPVRPRSDNEAP